MKLGPMKGVLVLGVPVRVHCLGAVCVRGLHVQENPPVCGDGLLDHQGHLRGGEEAGGRPGLMVYVHVCLEEERRKGGRGCVCVSMREYVRVRVSERLFL